MSPVDKINDFIASSHGFSSLKVLLFLLQGFKNFKMKIRGREEILVTVDVPPLSKVKFVEMSTSTDFRPASPCSKEIEPQNEHQVKFLIASYVKYKKPLVWVGIF